MQPRILLIGKNGQVGWELRRTLAPIGDIICLGSSELDLTKPDSIRQQVRQTQPNIVINAAAYTAVDKAESEPDLADKINGQAPGILAEECARTRALLVHYSTDYVFDGSKGEPYVETDATNPSSVYGRTKFAGELGIITARCAHLILRLCWVYGARGQNFMLTIQRLAREQERLRVVNDQVGCPTWSRMIAEATAMAVKQIITAEDASSLYGTYHLAASGQTSWHGFAEAIVSLMSERDKKCKVVEAVKTAEFPRPARRPAYSVLNRDKLKQLFGLQLPSWEEGLRQALEK